MHADSIGRLLRGWTSYVRAKPGMYFGAHGERAYGYALQNFLARILTCAPQHFPGPLSVTVKDGKSKQTVIIRFEGWESDLFSPETLTDWVKIFVWSPVEIGAPISGCDHFEIRSKRRGKLARLVVRDGTEASAQITRCRKDIQILEIRFEPHFPVFGRLSNDVIYWLCGRLRDLSSLRAGLITEFRATKRRISVRHEYAEGLRSRCSEESNDRCWPSGSLRADYFAVHAETASERIDAFIYTSLEGPSAIRTFVNFEPTSGGTHLQGLGRALLDLEKNFEKLPRWCRTPKVELITNPSTQAKLALDQGYRGFLHLQTSKPYYGGATKDILVGQHFYRLVRKAAYPQLLEQWRVFEAKRRAARAAPSSERAIS